MRCHSTAVRFRLSSKEVAKDTIAKEWACHFAYSFAATLAAKYYQSIDRLLRH